MHRVSVCNCKAVQLDVLDAKRDPSRQPAVLASVVIATKNRRSDVCDAIRSSLNQSVPVEVLVMDDGSTDGTAEIIRKLFPSVHLIRSATSLGYIVQRNRAANLVRGEFIFSIDDDATFPSSETVAQTLREFDHPRVGAVAIPYVEPLKSPVIRQHAPPGKEIFVTDSFVGTAHAVRRDVFMAVGGYREYLVHQGEETDFCIRMLQAGYIVRLGTANPIQHMESPNRDVSRMDYYGRRNDILFVWHNVPIPYSPLHLLGTTMNGFVTAFQKNRLRKMLQGLTRGYLDCVRFRDARRPVSIATYRLHRRLRKAGPRPFSDIESLLPGLLVLTLS